MSDRDFKEYPHLSSLSIEQLIRDVGLYSTIQISTWSEKVVYNEKTPALAVSDDVKHLYDLLRISKPVNLPCVECRKEYPFVRTNRLNVHITGTTGVNSSSTDYSFFSDLMMYNPDIENLSSLNSIASACQSVILKELSFFVIELSCTFNSDHKIWCAFTLESPPIDKGIDQFFRSFLLKKLKTHDTEAMEANLAAEDQEKLDYYHWAHHTLYLKKVGQSPSLADMQFFDLRKYQKILKDSYKELTRAIGLFSAGVGIGSFVYLRRILERLCEGSHQQCVKLPNWDEEKYKSSHFNERVEFLEQYGVQLLPSELAPVKSKLYSVMSKGIHEYSEKECLELFPCVQMAIELILDKRLEEIDRAAKIKEMVKQINNAT